MSDLVTYSCRSLPARCLVFAWLCTWIGRSIEGRWKLIMLKYVQVFPMEEFSCGPVSRLLRTSSSFTTCSTSPHEAKSLASMHPQRVTELRRHIEEWSADQ